MNLWVANQYASKPFMGKDFSPPLNYTIVNSGYLPYNNMKGIIFVFRQNQMKITTQA